MNKQKIALLVDSGCDLPEKFVKRDDVFVLPLKISFHDGHFLDGVDITGDEVLARLSQEVPKTALPDGQMIFDTLEKICQKGFEKVIAITISAGLSGTNNAVRLQLAEFPQLETLLVDTKNIGIGAGFSAILACELIDKGASFEEISTQINKAVPKSKIFFSVATLEYLKKGGRIGLVSAILGNALSLKPVISCNDEGVYYTVTKTRGLNKSREKLRQLILERVPQKGQFRFAVAMAGAKEEAAAAYAWLKEKFPETEVIYAPISPALSVHTGPGLLGIGIQEF
ncbi:DegV family protein [Enterococcus timonensis]|uniref:DegV family protein n=1 Tax=Enterococcus timonensis TaxID=1852364 RepID=UPI0008DAAE72|nr:DegV family protein [Enterococcus timonensis]